MDKVYKTNDHMEESLKQKIWRQSLEFESEWM